MQYLAFFCVCFIISSLATPFVQRIAVHIGALDYPNERKIHKSVIPRLGGLAIFISFLFGYTFFAANYQNMDFILVGAIMIVLMGIFDDIKPLKAWQKFLVQVIAAVIVVYFGNFVVYDIGFLDFQLVFTPVFAQIFTVVWIVGITNAINLIDGLDGLAAGISTISFVTIGMLAIFDNSLAGATLVATVAMILAGATAGFLVFNFPPAKIFMGDTGAQFLGFMIAILSVYGYKQAAFASFLVPIVILAIPILDTLFAIVRRVIKKQSFATPDRGHLHHRLLDSTKSPRMAIILIYLIDILFSSTAIMYSFSRFWGTILLIILLIVGEIFIEYFGLINARYRPLLAIGGKVYQKIGTAEQKEERAHRRRIQQLRNQRKREQKRRDSSK
ncbi:MraY family glycosyltransferase [Culicoidibacter larvae]|uniref:Undecaprenyl/decaprenyl-phosphate alpha-N-acetylglucosaminyl 1-phosphate transferase n=1 Tax=Culicoidibacter larvae TaxID=2579976 RepID=A0A5R8Q9I7_9FIRM|nr:MraY family glycosyltransferase [Culicoidibacter larvae]TLG71528.1 undecaprenyl/decaprenyl-phosphate alpha-N-acetylglucosaminyl 1-phosphate transferase [Culicoidibacter larvae]